MFKSLIQRARISSFLSHILTIQLDFSTLVKTGVRLVLSVLRIRLSEGPVLLGLRFLQNYIVVSLPNFYSLFIWLLPKEFLKLSIRLMTNILAVLLRLRGRTRRFRFLNSRTAFETKQANFAEFILKDKFVFLLSHF